VIGIYYAPTTTSPNTNGELTFGGIDSSKTTSSVVYAPITSTSPASEYWGIDQSISYGSESILSTTAGIVDTGTTLVMIADDAFSKYTAATGATSDSTTGLYTITAAQYAALKPLNFLIGGKTFSLNPNAQIFPRSLNANLGGTAGKIYLIVSSVSAVQR
jgi:pepsin A